METIDYKVNVDVQEALSQLQIVDMTANQAMSSPGYAGGAFGGFTHTQQAFGDLAFSGGQFAQRMMAPVGTFQTGVPTGISTMPHISFGTAATAMVAPGQLMLPHGVSRSAFEHMAQEQFAVRMGRGVAGAAAGAAEFGVAGIAGGLGAAAGGALLGSVVPVVGTVAGALIGGFAGYLGVSKAMSPMFSQMEDQNLLEDVVQASSRRFLGPEYSTDPSGRGYGHKSSRRIATGIRHMGLNDPLLDTNDLANILGTGAAMGFFDAEVGSGGVSADEYLDKFRKLTSDVKKVATALGTSLSEGMATMQQLKGIGFGVGQMGGVIDTIHGMAGGDPQAMRGLIATGGMGASMFQGTGMSTTGGFWQGIQASGMAAAAGNSIGGQAMMHAGGQRAVTQMLMGSNINFQQGGAGMVMQAGLQGGGASMGMGFMDMVNAGGGALGGMGAGGMADFMMTRMEEVGNMSASERFAMQRKQYEWMAEASRGSLSVEQAAFWSLREGYGDQRARVLARAYGRGGGGGGGGRASRRLALRSELATEREAYRQASSPTAVIGGWRDAIARKASVPAEWFGGIGDAYGDKIAREGVFGIGGLENAERVGGGNADVILDFREGRLDDSLMSTSGLSVSHYEWSDELGDMLGGMHVGKERPDSGAGVIDFGSSKWSVEQVGEAIDKADKAADEAFNTRAYKRMSGGPHDSDTDYAKAMRRISRAMPYATDLHAKAAGWARQGNITAFANAAGLDMTEAGDVAALRTSWQSRYGVELRRGQVGGRDLEQAVAVAFEDRHRLGIGGMARVLDVNITGGPTLLRTSVHRGIAAVGLGFTPWSFGGSMALATGVIYASEGHSLAQTIENKEALAAATPALLQYAEEMLSAGGVVVRREGIRPELGSIQGPGALMTQKEYWAAETGIRKDVTGEFLSEMGYGPGATITGGRGIGSPTGVAGPGANMGARQKTELLSKIELETARRMRLAGHGSLGMGSIDAVTEAAPAFDEKDALERALSMVPSRHRDLAKGWIENLSTQDAGSLLSAAAASGEQGAAVKKKGASTMTTAIAMGADPTQTELVQTLLAIQAAMERIAPKKEPSGPVSDEDAAPY